MSITVSIDWAMLRECMYVFVLHFKLKYGYLKKLLLFIDDVNLMKQYLIRDFILEEYYV